MHILCDFYVKKEALNSKMESSNLNNFFGYHDYSPMLEWPSSTHIYLGCSVLCARPALLAQHLSTLLIAPSAFNPPSGPDLCDHQHQQHHPVTAPLSLSFPSSAWAWSVTT